MNYKSRIIWLCFTCFEELHPDRALGLTSYKDLRCYRCGKSSEKCCLYDIKKLPEAKKFFEVWLVEAQSKKETVV
jgi:hypothetical protein